MRDCPVAPARRKSIELIPLPPQTDLTCVRSVCVRGFRGGVQGQISLLLCGVSTDKQGRSGLGLEAQREAVSSYLNGGKWTLVQEYVETESGRRSDRPKLAAALAHAKAIGATIVFAKLDRLSIELLVQNYLTAERNLVAAVDAAGGAIALPDGRTVTTARAEFDAR